MKKGTILITAGALLITAAISVSGYNIYDNFRAGQSADAILDALMPAINSDPVPPSGRPAGSYAGETDVPAGEIEYPDYVLDPNIEMPVVTVDEKNCIGVVSLPAIDITLPVLSDWSYDDLRLAPCRYSGSAYTDDLVICAHNYTIHFGRLADLSYGDYVVFTDIDGNEFLYSVVETESVRPTEIDRMISGEWDMTLFTCTLDGRTRLAVRCEKIK